MKLSKTKLILLGIGSVALLGTGIYLLVRTKKDEEKGGGETNPPPAPPVEPTAPTTNNGNGGVKEMSYAECKAKNPFKNKQEVIDFQKYAISKGYNVGSDGAKGDYGCKSHKAYEELKDSYKTYVAFQSTVPKTQNDARQKAIGEGSSSYLWEGYVYRTSDNVKLQQDPRGKSLYIKPNVNEVNVRVTPSNSSTIANGLSNYSGVIKNQGGKKVATITSYIYNRNENRMYYMVSNFVVTLYDRSDTSKPIVNPKAGYISSNSSEAK